MTESAITLALVAIAAVIGCGCTILGDRRRFRDLDTRVSRTPILWEATSNYTGQPGRWILGAGRLRASMHLPKVFSRATLVVTDVKVERLQNISNEDAVSEGIYEESDFDRDLYGYTYDTGAPIYETPRDAFRALWELVNGPGAWLTNPWVAAYRYDFHPVNIDHMEGAA